MEKTCHEACETTEEMWERVQDGAEYIVRYFAEKKFTVADAMRALDAARRGIEAETTVNMLAPDTSEARFRFW